MGQAWTQAPHDTQSDSMNGLPPGEIFESNPRPSTVSANVPCTSSHARTQREHTMHLLASNAKYGLLASVGASVCVAPGA